MSPEEERIYHGIVVDFPATQCTAIDYSGAISAKWVGSAVAEISGYEVEELESEPDLWRNIIHPTDKARVMESFRRLTAGEAVCEDYRVSRKDGQTRWVRETSLPGTNDAGKVVRAVSAIFEVSEPARDPETLRQCEARLRTLLDNVPFEFWHQDAARVGAMGLTEKMESIRQAAKHSAQMGALAQISQAFVSSLDFEQIVDSATDLIGKVLNCSCGLLKLDPSTCRLSCVPAAPKRARWKPRSSSIFLKHRLSWRHDLYDREPGHL